MRYAELHCLSNFTFLRGASHPEELVEQAARLGYTALALTDECSLAGIVRAHTAAKDFDIKLIVGAEFTLSDGLRLVILASDREAYGDLSALISIARLNAAKGDYCLSREDLERHIQASRCLVLWLAGESPDQAAGEWLKCRFDGRLWLAVELLKSGRDRQVLADCLAAAQALDLRAVASGDVHMHDSSRRMLQDTLTAIRIGQPVERLGHAIYPNAERAMRPMPRLQEIYPPALLQETIAIAERIDFSLTELRYEYPSELVPEGLDATMHLRSLTEAGAQWRWPDGVIPKVRRLIEHELKLIAELNYEPYFLTVHDIVRYARSEGILCQGRGSAANSAVCFCLGITEVDPARMEMLMERFISKERNEPPDIDVDFEHDRREEVIQYIYRKYSRERAALAATVISYRPRSAIRDVGKALGLSLDQVDRLASSLQWWDEAGLAKEKCREIGLDPDGIKAQQLFYLVSVLVGFPRHLSQHVGGFVISAGPLSRLVPIENAAMPERTVIQWDKDDLDELGLLKIDVLGLGMLSAIRRSLELIESCSGRKLTVADIPAEDPAVYDMIGNADTMGVFQIESRAQMAMLPRLRPRCYYDLVIEVAIIRPGPIQGDMVHPYLRRRNGEEAVSYPSEAVRGVLERTLGVPIFQEQVMQLAIVAAGFTPGEADQLRRAMAAWKRRGGLGPLKGRLIGGMLKKGYEQRFAEQIFNQIQGFGEYGFPESHSASFALLVYVSAWLKCHEPAAFFCALLNSQPMGFYAPAQLIRTAKRQGVAVHPVMVDRSNFESSLELDYAGTAAIRLGFRLVKGLSRAGAERIEAARAEQAFRDLEDLARRTDLDQRDIGALAAAGALKTLADHRYRARWEVAGIDLGAPLLAEARIAEGIPLLRRPTEGEDIVADYAATGLSLGRHPLALLRSRLGKMGLQTAADIHELAHHQMTRAAGLVITRQRPSSAAGVVFVTLEDETGYLNLIVWEKLALQARGALLESRLMGVAGRVQRDGDVLHIIASKLFDLSG
ncbi:MAG TPA: error-prone DNA polymerase, partial [Gammaproteobacteria bacterium]